MGSDDDYRRYPPGSPEHYKGHARKFGADHGIDGAYALQDEPEDSYDAFYDAALGYELQGERLYRQEAEEAARWWRDRGIQLAEDLLDDPESWLGYDWWHQSRISEHGSEPDIDLEPF